MTPPPLIHLAIDRGDLDLIIEGLAHLEAADVDAAPDQTALARIRDAQLLAACLRLERDLLGRRPDSSGITTVPDWRPAC